MVDVKEIKNEDVLRIFGEYYICPSFSIDGKYVWATPITGEILEPAKRFLVTDIHQIYKPTLKE